MTDDKNKQLLLSLIYSFQMQTMMQLGKLANPMTNTIEKHLDGAQVTIDMLDMLKAKSKGNLGDDEIRFLDQVIADLKLNYVEERDKENAPVIAEAKEAKEAKSVPAAEIKPEDKNGEMSDAGTEIKSEVKSEEGTDADAGDITKEKTEDKSDKTTENKSENKTEDKSGEEGKRKPKPKTDDKPKGKTEDKSKK